MRAKIRLNALAIASREAWSMARQAVLLPRDALKPVLPKHLAPGDDVVVFLHGLMGSAGVLRPLRAAVASISGAHVCAFTCPSGPGIAELSALVGKIASELPVDVRVHLVGHSLGGVVARHYAETANDARVVQTISLAAPFAGIAGMKLLGFALARDLAPESPLLRALRLGARDVPHLSIIADADAILGTPMAHALPGGDVVLLRDRSHGSILFDAEVAKIVARRVLALRSPPKR